MKYCFYIVKSIINCLYNKLHSSKIFRSVLNWTKYMKAGAIAKPLRNLIILTIHNFSQFSLYLFCFCHKLRINFLTSTESNCFCALVPYFTWNLIAANCSLITDVTRKMASAHSRMTFKNDMRLRSRGP